MTTDDMGLVREYVSRWGVTNGRFEDLRLQIFSTECGLRIGKSQQGEGFGQKPKKTKHSTTSFASSGVIPSQAVDMLVVEKAK
jgi:hypothetical protein